MSDFYSESEHKARKEHKCYMCGYTIEVGKKYKRTSGVHEGFFFDNCFHSHCLKMAYTYCSDESENEFDSEVVTDWLTEKYCYGCDRKEDCVMEPTSCGLVISDFQPTE